MFVSIFREPASAWTHLVGLSLAVPGALVLGLRRESQPGEAITLRIYGFCLIFCYAASTLYHGVRLPADRLDAFIRLDSVGIFALIAGTYTPLAWTLTRGHWRSGILGLVWGVAIGSSALIAAGRPFSRVTATGIYLGLGWGVVVCYARLARVVSHRALLPLVLGGLFYSVGAVLNLLGRPRLWPGVFGPHDVFHLFVIAGSLAHFWFILKVVVPFEGQP